MGKSEAGSILALIEAIITFVVAAIILIVGVIFLTIPAATAEIQKEGLTVGFIFAFFLIAASIVFVIGYFKLYASKLMKSPKTTLKGGIIALVLGIVSGGLLCIIGGILGIVEGSNK